jgi:hypothetical protein
MEKDTIQINRLLNTPGSHSVRRWENSQGKRRRDSRLSRSKIYSHVPWSQVRQKVRRTTWNTPKEKNKQISMTPKRIRDNVTLVLLQTTYTHVFLNFTAIISYWISHARMIIRGRCRSVWTFEGRAGGRDYHLGIKYLTKQMLPLSPTAWLNRETCNHLPTR